MQMTKEVWTVQATRQLCVEVVFMTRYAQMCPATSDSCVYLQEYGRISSMRHKCFLFEGAGFSACANMQ